MKRSTTPLNDELAALTAKLADVKAQQAASARQRQQHTAELDDARRELVDVRARALTAPGDEEDADRLAARIAELETQTSGRDDGPVYDRAVQLASWEVERFATANADALLDELAAKEQAAVDRLDAAVSEARAALDAHARVNTAGNRVLGLADGRSPIHELAPFDVSNAMRALDDLAGAPRPLRRLSPAAITLAPEPDTDDGAEAA